MSADGVRLAGTVSAAGGWGVADDEDGVRFDPYREAVEGRLARKRLRGLVPQVVEAFRLLRRVDPRSSFIVWSVQAVSAAGIAAQVVLTKVGLDALLGGAPVSAVLPPLLLIVVVSGVVSVLTALQGQFQVLLGELVVRDTWQRVLEAAVSMPLLAFEGDDYFDRLQRIKSNALLKPLQLAQGAIGLVGGVLGIAGLMLAVLALQPLVVPVILLAGLPFFWLARRGGRLEWEFALRTTRNVRERFALIELMSERGPAKEVRAFVLRGWLRDRFDRNYAEYLRELRRKVGRRVRIAALSAAAGAVLAGAAVAVLLALIDQRSLSLPVAGATLAAVVLLGGRLQQLFDGASSMLEAGMFIEDVERFEALGRIPPRAGRGTPRTFERIELRDVDFQYPGAATPAVRDVTLTLRRGETVALVGPNGSGKTTVSKLLANLYTPTSGSVRWDGEDLRELDQEQVARSIAVLFQDFVRYELTLLENIGVGDESRMADRSAIERTAGAAGADAAAHRLAGGFDTLLSTRYPDGSDLSTGQWQRVAMARALFRDAPLVVLDEPTAALDPRAEAELYEAMSTVLADRTVLLVTHRFASARRADRIVVLDAGAVIEQGTHEQLMAAGGYYREMFDLQAAAFDLAGDAEA